MSEKDKNKLAQNFQSKSILRTIREIQEKKKKILAWKIFGDVKITAPVRIKVIRSHRGEILLETHEDNIPLLHRILGGTQKINFYIPNGNVLFQCKLKDMNPNGSFVVYIPDMVVRQERRKSLRCSVTDDRVKVQFAKDLARGGGRHDHIFDKKLYDISEGGLSIILTSTESKYFQNNDVIENVKLSISGKIMTVGVKLVNLIPVDPDPYNGLAYRGFRACFSFTDIDDKKKEIIEIYVLSNIKLDEIA
ncbi:MAG: PilZ domain-containing protein [Halobacteriovoraceae bacterium]|nr:PilZ domain-containing protein [Halobacteriovoraceae bacterium]